MFMRRARLVLDNGGCYHCISRVVDRRFIFGAAEKRFFRSTMRRLEAFLGVRVLTYCLMSNHFHLLVEVPDPDQVEALTLESLRRRLPQLYRGAALALVTDEINRAEASAASAGSSLWLEEILVRYQARIGSLSMFLKELKQRFTQWYNTRHQRCGTLWEDRFKSVLVEGDEHALMTMAAYIELNPVRAGLVGDPKDYPWCGYAEAVAGSRLARRNLSAMHARTRAWQGQGRQLTWREVAPVYRMHLFGKGERRLGDGHTAAGARAGIAAQRVRQVVEVEGGRLPLAELLRCRVRYFCDGAVFGSVGFVNGVFEAHRERFGAKRESGARAMRGAEDWGGLSTLRDLRKGVFGEGA
jgi:putative transposase